jgi:hypothetical protein
LLLRADIHQLFDARRLKLKVPPYSKDGETAPIQVELDDELQKDESLRNLHKKSLIHPALQDPITRGLLAKVSRGGGVVVEEENEAWFIKNFAKTFQAIIFPLFMHSWVEVGKPVKRHQRHLEQ